MSRRPGEAASSRIYTRLGDDGSTGLLFGGRVRKSGPLVELLGCLDEAVAALGMLRALSPEWASLILRLQRELFVAAADVACNPHQRSRLEPGKSSVTAEMATALEREIDDLVARNPLEPVFVVPGTNQASAACDLARTAVRRAERAALNASMDSPPSQEVIRYLNRLSDLLYVLARVLADGSEPASHA